jgi:ABC-type molybdate transport system substrate-binding protein
MSAKRVLTIAVLLAAVTSLVCSGCGQRESGNRVRVLCGTSMAQPMKDIAESFKKAQGAEVEFDLGGSETLLPKVLLGSPADVFVCHDPFEQKVQEAGQRTDSVVVGWLEPILVTAVGNPKQIKDWDDLGREGLRLGIGDPRYSTCGEMFVAELRRRGLEEKVMKNVIVQARTHTDLALAVIAGSLDAASVWNFVVPQYAGKLDKVSLMGEYPETRVTIIGLKNSPQPKLRDQLLEWCRRPESVQRFAEGGYARSATSKSQSQ